MKIFFQALFGLFLGILLTGCFRNDLRTAEFQVPGLKSQECLNYLSGKLRGADGVMDVKGDFNTGKVTVQFNGLKLAIKNIEIYIADAGFDVNQRPGSETGRAAMPAACR